jgi:hypothetical protein
MRQLISAVLVLFFSAQLQAKTSERLHFGFNLLSPKKATGILITKQQERNFSACSPSLGFGPHTPIKQCKIGKNQEWIIYGSQKACQEEIQVMRWNGESA